MRGEGLEEFSCLDPFSVTKATALAAPQHQHFESMAGQVDSQVIEQQRHLYRYLKLAGALMAISDDEARRARDRRDIPSPPNGQTGW
jgi:hypothetical protein